MTRKRIIEETITEGIRVTSQARLEVFSPMPEGHPCYTLVGHIAAEAARIELMLDSVIAALANLNPIMAACITSQLSGTNPRFDALRKLTAIHGLTEFEKPLNSMKSATQKDMVGRNAAIHDPWSVNSAGESHQQQSMRKPGEYGYRPVSEHDLRETLKALQARRDKINDLLNQILEKARP